MGKGFRVWGLLQDMGPQLQRSYISKQLQGSCIITLPRPRAGANLKIYHKLIFIIKKTVYFFLSFPLIFLPVFDNFYRIIFEIIFKASKIIHFKIPTHLFGLLNVLYKNMQFVFLRILKNCESQSI